MTQNISIPCSQENFRQVEEIMSKYDLHSVCNRTGAIHRNITYLFDKKCQEFPDMFPIKCLSLAQVMHLTIMTVCYLQDIDCPPIIRLPARRKSITNFEKMEETLKENESWVRELQHVNVLTGKLIFFAMQCKQK